MDETFAAQVFEDWKRRYDEDPESFDDCEAFRERPPATYGEGAARYFFWLAERLADERA